MSDPRPLGTMPQHYPVRFFTYDEKTGLFWETNEPDFSKHAIRFEWGTVYQRWTNDEGEVVIHLRTFPNTLENPHMK